ncbi:MAG: HprK-related kinase A [Gammaproteobacteria bacterium]|nr:HprK-related kinase A [Gammaproteobacteria bacterium]
MPEQQLIFDAGPFRVRVRSSETEFSDTLAFFYGDTLLQGGSQVLDYDIVVHRTGNPLRRWLRPQIQFAIDGINPFEPHPLDNAFPMFEWGLNWCIATSAHRYLMLHAGSVAFDGQAMLLPGTPGAGKSTLSAALHLAGARLLSDEFGLLRPESGDLLPMPRGIPLKNASIEAMLAFDAAAPLGPTYPNTRKGRVRHLRPAPSSLAEQQTPATPRWLVFPQFQSGADEQLTPLDEVEAFKQLAFNCFNYKLLGEVAFRAVARLVRQVDCYRFTFGRLDRAVEHLRALTEA